MVIICATLVTLGFLIGVLPASFFGSSSLASSFQIFSSSSSTTSSPTVSLVYGILSSLFIAVHAVLIKSSMPHVDGSTLKLAWWTNAGSALALVPCILFSGEIVHLRALVDDIRLGEMTEEWEWRTFVWGSAITGIFGFFLCVAGLLSIKVTSPITHMFSSVSRFVTLYWLILRCIPAQAAKGVLQTLLGIWIFNDILTTCVSGSFLKILHRH